MRHGLIFDCDGVLVDSEPLAVDEVQAMFAKLGVPLSEDRIYRDFLGRSASVIVEMAARELGLDVARETAACDENLLRRFRRELRPVPGVAQAIAALEGPRAVASSSAPDRLALSLALTGLAPLFGPHVYSASQVRKGKPAPDLFLFAAQKLGADPAACVVVEDSPAGVMAARAAGMRVVGFLGGGHAAPARLAERLAALKPDALIERAEELPDALTRLGWSAIRKV
ncbi:HAD family hydrolase [Neomegalonema perideroedes]|uniref:HAD family hydrolase n=1 Tax=Neomegalonema perideroedes TaxID=217219 RepID=UPI000475821E|nr:HAD family phosphatase [Neomegalonema perideroedes]